MPSQYNTVAGKKWWNNRNFWKGVAAVIGLVLSIAAIGVGIAAVVLSAGAALPFFLGIGLAIFGLGSGTFNLWALIKSVRSSPPAPPVLTDASELLSKQLAQAGAKYVNSGPSPEKSKLLGSKRDKEIADAAVLRQSELFNKQPASPGKVVDSLVTATPAPVPVSSVTP
jgi:hypothetical protein